MSVINESIESMEDTALPEMSLLPIDVGFDLKLHPEIAINLIAGEQVAVRYISNLGHEMRVSGPREEVANLLRASGYIQIPYIRR